jgi:predicted RNA-binding Zn ribbon-like protein
MKDYAFVGGALALDLVNTEVAFRGERRDLLATPDEVVEWWRAALARYPEHRIAGAQVGKSEDRGELFGALKSLRRALRGIFVALAEERRVEEADLEVLNGVLSTGYRSLEITPGGDLVPTYRTRDAGRGEVLLPIAISAFELITRGDAGRLHECRNPKCVLLFYDTSKSATRRWCSTACMNRARSAQRYRQRKAREAD